MDSTKLLWKFIMEAVSSLRRKMVGNKYTAVAAALIEALLRTVYPVYVS